MDFQTNLRVIRRTPGRNCTTNLAYNLWPEQCHWPLTPDPTSKPQRGARVRLTTLRSNLDKDYDGETAYDECARHRPHADAVENRRRADYLGHD